jgi:hypothetical protein
MSGLVRHRSTGRRALRLAIPLVLLLAVSGTLAVALQVHEIRVSGTNHFSVAEVEGALRVALGTPTIATRAERLREVVRTIPWVADASVRVSLDGIVSCAVAERTPVAQAFDNGAPLLLDAEGRILGPNAHDFGLLKLEGFAPYPEERAAALAAVDACQQAWSGRLERIERLGPNDVVLHFARTAFPVLADPARPELLERGRIVAAAWLASTQTLPLRVDARIGERIAVLPAPVPPSEEVTR